MSDKPATPILDCLFQAQYDAVVASGPGWNSFVVSLPEPMYRRVLSELWIAAPWESPVYDAYGSQRIKLTDSMDVLSHGGTAAVIVALRRTVGGDVCVGGAWPIEVKP